ncbi:hypothetical protein COO60DRAFT_1196495 [Scenedesmus sp. NREL 46B-D3]|nr:hypothetical protein COO60DRAFT_1196495 [Scenedesmus sp. NREL 46B-D3]
MNGSAESSMSGSRSGSSSGSSSSSTGALHIKQQRLEQHSATQQHAHIQRPSAEQPQQHWTASTNGSSTAAPSQWGKRADTSPTAAAATAEAAEQSAAAAADAAFMQLLLLLAQHAAFVPLSARDVALGVSLNTDFLWQLFVKVSTEQLDATLVPPQLLAASAGAAGDAAGAGGSGGPAAVPAGQPKETESLLVLRRGYSSEQQQGRWLLQKLDYLQLLLVKRAIGGLTRLGGHLLQQARGMDQRKPMLQRQLSGSQRRDKAAAS